MANKYAKQLEQALEASEKDVKDASAGVLKDLKRFQKEKEEDLKRYMVRFPQFHHIPHKIWESYRERILLLTEFLFHTDCIR